MADHLGNFHPVIHVTVENVQVSAADAAVGDANLHLAPGRRNWHAIGNLKGFLTGIVGSTHNNQYSTPLSFFGS